MAIIKKKSWPKIFTLIKSGKKKFDLRVADFKVKVGDTLVLEEYDPKKKRYTGRKLAKKVKYVMKFGLNDYGQKKEIDKKGLYIIQV
jgi:ASC-1-like (ASCH) protein